MNCASPNPVLHRDDPAAPAPAGGGEREARTMRFLKMNGAGNAFAIFDARAKGRLTLEPDQAAAIAKATRADQVIAIEPAERADVFMRIWNADGGEVGACGNAARCVAWLIMNETARPETSIDTAGGLLRAERAGETRITVDMGIPKLDWTEIPLEERMDTRGIDLKVGPIDNPALQLPGAVNMGNPHVVFFVENADKAPVEAVGRMIERHPLFPEGVNVGFAEIRDRDRIRLRVWERGAGLTKACGSGACAALVAAHRRRMTDRKATVIVDGGELLIDWRANNHVFMTGPIELEDEGSLPL